MSKTTRKSLGRQRERGERKRGSLFYDCLWHWFCGSEQRDGKSTDIRASVGQSSDNSLVNVYEVFLTLKWC